MGAQPAILDPGLEHPEPQVEPRPRLSVSDLGLSIDRRIVLDDVRLAVKPGEVFGILGPNGSGKTSLMRCLTGLWRADRGAILIDGEAIESNRRLRARMGVVFQDPSLDDKLTARENLLLGAALFGVRGAEARTRADDLLRFMELSDRANDNAGILSGGMRRRLEVARALIHQPSVLLLDEPTVGLDMVAFQRTWQRLLALRNSQALSLLVTTHRPEEAAQCDRLAVLDRGHIVACDTPERLLERVSGDVVIIEAAELEALADDLREHFELSARIDENRLLIERDRGHELIPRLIEAFPAGRFRSVSLRKPSLEDAFFHLTGHSLQEDETL